jgi:antitoxin component of RelBE/YafQ-DinJ toxin-antitoxin module
MKKLIEKDDVISVRIDAKVKSKLTKLSSEYRREFSDFIRLILIDVAEGKIKINL